MTRAHLLIATFLLCGVTTAEAQARRRVPARRPRPVDPDRFDWQRTSGQTPKPSAYDQAMARADAEMTALFRRRIDDPRAELAQRHLKAAIAADPTKAEPHYRLAILIFQLYLEDRSEDWVFTGVDERRTNLVLAHWAHFERLAPLDPRMNELLFERAILHTKLPAPESYAKAKADYTRYVSYLKAARPGLAPDKNIAISLSNMAEVCMMGGDLETAKATYDESMAIEQEYSTAFGYAVALDRDGQTWKARELIREHADTPTLNNFIDRLTGRNPAEPRRIFYVPPGEIHYYFGLIHDALGNYAIAASEFEQFIDSGDHPHFEQRARDHVADLKKKLRGATSGGHAPASLAWWHAWVSKAH